MGYAIRGEVWIPIDDWNAFVGNYIPKMVDCMVSLGPPREEEGEIVVPFAANTECHPRDEAEPPEWIKK